MDFNNVESREPLFHDQTETGTSSKPKQEVAPQSPLHTPYRDSTFTFGIIASTRTDTLNMDTRLHLSHYNPTTNKCEITQQQTPKASDSDDPDSDSAFVTLVALAFLSAPVLTTPLILLLVSLLRRYPHALVVLSAPFMSLLLLGLGLLGGLFWFSRCLSVPAEVWLAVLGSKEVLNALYVLCTSALFGYMLWETWTRSVVESGVEVLRTATKFWKEHFVLLVVNPMLLAGAMVVVNRPIFTLMWYAFNVGEIVPDFDVVNDPTKGCGLANGIRCCRQARPGWVHAYITFASITVFWVLTVSMVLQHSVVNGTVSLWYFAPAGSSAIGNIKRSLRNAYGSSFGRACNLGTIVTTLVAILVRFLKEKLSDKVLKNNNQGLMSSVLEVFFSWMSGFPEHYPRLPSIFLGISESSKKSHQSLSPQASLIPTSMSTNSQDLGADALWGIFVTSSLLQVFAVHLELDYSNAFAPIAVAYCFPIVAVGLATGFFVTVISVIKSVSICSALERDVSGGEISRNCKPKVCQEFMTTTAPSLPGNEAQVAER